MSDQIMRASTEMSPLVPELWSGKFYPALKENMIFADSIGQDYQGEIQALGDIVNITSIPQFSTAYDLAEDERADADAVTMTTSQLSINHQIVKDFILTDKVIAQGLDAMMELRDLAIHAILKKMQALIIADVVPSASAPDHQIAYTSGSTLALADCLAAKELLDAAKVPNDGKRVIALGEAQLNDLFVITGFTSKDFIDAGSPLMSGALPPSILGFNLKWSTECGAVARFFHSSFMQMAVQKLPEVSIHNLGVDGKRAKRVNVTALFGNVQVDNKRVVEIS